MEYVGADWIHLVHHNNMWRVIVNTALREQFADQQIIRAASDNRRVTNRKHAILTTKYTDTRVATQLYLSASLFRTVTGRLHNRGYFPVGARIYTRVAI